MIRAVGSFVQNFRASDLALHRRVALAMRNLGIRAIRRQACCGHPGQPGC